jgi:ribosome recycling factor
MLFIVATHIHPVFVYCNSSACCPRTPHHHQAKQDIRQVRKVGMDTVKKLKGAVSEDDTRKYTKEIDALMEKKIENVARALKDKETEILR